MTSVGLVGLVGLDGLSSERRLVSKRLGLGYVVHK